MRLTIILVIVSISTSGVTAADWWGDFYNNLFTDLTPLIALFGEQPTKQFLSESLTYYDAFIFAMAPLGTLTAIVSAIRVQGNTSLRAFIGRAQEGTGAIEAELCSSTSRDICEIYINGGITRTFGTPRLLELVHDSTSDRNSFVDKNGSDTTLVYIQPRSTSTKIREIGQNGSVMPMVVLLNQPTRRPAKAIVGGIRPLRRLQI
jgi:hypothetical protein